MDESEKKQHFAKWKIYEGYIERSDTENDFWKWRYTTEFLRATDSTSFITLNKIFSTYIEQPQKIHTYYIYGEMQIGKTRRLICFANELILKNMKISYLQWYEFIKKITCGMEYGRTLTKENLEYLQMIFKKSDCIIIDDFKYNDAKAVEIIFQEIERCLNLHTKPIIFVSNYSINEIRKDFEKKAKYDKNLFSIDTEKFFNRIENECKEHILEVKKLNLQKK